MLPLAHDTPAHIETDAIAVLRGMNPAQKAAMLTQMCAMSDRLAVAGIRMQHTQITAAEAGFHLALRRIPVERHATAQPLLEALPSMTYPVNPVALAVRIGAILDLLGIRYYMGGSFASSIFGEYRTTRDLDVILEYPGPQHTQLATAFATVCTFLPEDIRNALAQRQTESEGFVSFTMYDRETGYQVDVFLARTHAYERVQFERRLSVDLVEGTVWIPSAEDAILNKLRWYALTPSDMQWRDVQAMIRVQATSLDTAYLRTWAHALGIAQVLDHALAGTKPPTALEPPDQMRLF